MLRYVRKLIQKEKVFFFLSTPHSLNVSLTEVIHFCYSECYSSYSKVIQNRNHFQSNNAFFEHTGGVAMGSPLSLVIADFYMKKFEEIAFQTAPKKSMLAEICGWHITDLESWGGGSCFLDHLNSLHQSIQFTVENGGGKNDSNKRQTDRFSRPAVCTTKILVSHFTTTHLTMHIEHIEMCILRR